MRQQQPAAGRGQGPQMRSVIDFGEGAGALPAARTASIESGMHNRTGSHGGGPIGGGGSGSGGGGLDFYAVDAAAVPRGTTPPGQMMGGGGSAPIGSSMLPGGPTARGAGAAGYSALPTAGGLPHGRMSQTPLARGFSSGGAFLGEGFEDEPPILEELGINLSHIASKTRAVLNPRRSSLSVDYMQDADLAGPLVFCLGLGLVLLLKGKASFGAIYGCGAIGCGGMYVVLNLMSAKGIDIYRTISVLGYCLLPVILLAAVSALVELKGALGYVLIPCCVLWCTNAAALFFVVALGLDDQRWLVAYPVMLFYACFALISVF